MADTPAAAPRLYYGDLDVARGVLMALGVFLHSAVFFSTDVFANYGADSDPGPYRFLVDAIHLFRMPAFFAVSGFFCAMSLRRQSVIAFLRLKSRRILVPLLSVLLTFNMIELWLRQAARSEPEIHAGAAFRFPLDPTLFGELLLHLWFLVVVFVYFLLAMLVAAMVAAVGERRHKIARGAFARIERMPNAAIGIWFLAAIALAYAPHAAGSLGPELIYPQWVFGIAPFTILYYAPFFAFGAALHFMPQLTERWRQFSLPKLLGFSAAIVLVPAVAASGWFGETAMVAVSAIGAWICVLSIFGLFNAAMRLVGDRSRAFAEPAYTIYLLHHILVFLLGWLLLSQGIDGALAFGLIVAITLGLTLTIHYAVVRKSAAMRLLLNGK
ncbi:MAG: acyltransferase family protein [Erythrobacter sp.]|uniref:acyltransferase family protein n=1 Tax=Erythrobacter sp. TaxID=1042 RepID=UPI001AFDFF12|nr:acyltransferase family protein [Erythrobacter sp.]MBO6767800.1 acyltransferase family protein [Erythrobacter sp.]